MTRPDLATRLGLVASFMRVEDIETIRIKLASPEVILNWSFGEVTKAETINYRTQRAEKDGLFCQKIFGPEKDYECYCGRYKGIRYKGIVCDKCGVEVIKSNVRRERMGHINLAVPCAHIWFLKGVPSRAGLILDIPALKLERITYFSGYIITKVSVEEKKKVLEEMEKEYKGKQKLKIKKAELAELKMARDRAKEEILQIKPLKILSEVEYRELSLKYGQCFEAGTGAETLREIFAALDLKKLAKDLRAEINVLKTGEAKRKILRRLRVIEGMLRAQIKPEWMFLTVLPVLPPDLRPMVQLDGGRYASSDLNDLYRRVINRNNRLKYLLEISAPDVIVRNEKRMLQEAVDALIDNGMRRGITIKATTGGRRLLKSLADIIKGKQGRFRQNLLGKRVDYSGRSVIVVGAELKLHQCGLPKKMALELFKPFVIRKILERELAYNVRGASKLVEAESDEVWEILEEVVKNKLVLLNRAPTLHRLGIQAFEPLLIEGEAIRIHPLTCRAFNADFDGDQMAVHLPLSNKAQKEAKEIMLSSLNLLKPATGTPVVTPTKDIILGCYWLTYIKEGVLGEGKIFSSEKEAILAQEMKVIDLRAKIKVKGCSKGNVKSKKNDLLETTVGRILFNQTLPEDFPFQNKQFDAKKLEKLLAEIIAKFGWQIATEVLDKVKDLGFEYSTLSGMTLGMDDLIVPSQKPEIIRKAEKEIETINSQFSKGLLSLEEKRNRVIGVWTEAKSEIEKLLPKTLPETGPVSSIVNSGARGSWTQPVQMAGMKGLVINPAGRIIELPIRHSYIEGFDVLEYFISTHGARKGTADTALRTSTAGYLTRKLIDVAHEIIVSEEDCRDKEGIVVWKEDVKEIGQSFLLKIVGRVSLEEVKSKGTVIVKEGEIIDWQKGNQIIEAGIKELRVRSPLSCKSLKGVCQKCYGWDLGNNQLVKIGQGVGIVAAQAIGEPGIQLTMRTFHIGGVAGSGDITQGLPRVVEIFEIRKPAREALVSRAEGKVMEINKEGVIKIKSLKSKDENLKSKGKKSEIVEYKISSDKAIWAKVGQEIKKGQQLCEGDINLKEFFKLVGFQKTQRYIIKEIQKIYVSQGALIHDKHIETIIRQMFSRLRIKDPGDSLFIVGEVIEKTKLLEENANLKKAHKKPAKGEVVLLGISKVALTTDSFLSAASFQETTRVLIKAALEGKEDKLRGLKENVMIGKLIPAGTGFKK